VFALRSHYTEVFANLPMTLAALSDDVVNDVAPRWFSAADLKSLNVTQSVDLFFVSELYMMQEIISAVCFVIVLDDFALTQKSGMYRNEAWHDW